MKLKWKLTITHGYDEIVFIFDTLSVAENFLRTFLEHKQPDEPVSDPLWKKDWSYVISPVLPEKEQAESDETEDDIPVQ